MDSLRNYLNKMTQEEQKNFAARCKTTIGYLRKAIYKRQELGVEISVSIEINSDGEVTRESLHPDNFMNKWPELKQRSLQ